MEEGGAGLPLFPARSAQFAKLLGKIGDIASANPVNITMNMGSARHLRRAQDLRWNALGAMGCDHSLTPLTKLKELRK